MIISEKTIRQIIRREMENQQLKESGEDTIRKIVRKAIHEQYGTGGGDWYSDAGPSPYGAQASKPDVKEPEAKVAPAAPPKKKAYSWAQGSSFPYKYGQQDKSGGPGHIAKFQKATGAGGGVDGKYGRGTAAAVAKITGDDGKVLTQETYDKAVGGKQVAKAASGAAMVGKTKQKVDADEGTKTWEIRIPYPGKDASKYPALKKRLWDETVQRSKIEMNNMSNPGRNTKPEEINWITLNKKTFTRGENGFDQAFKFLKASGFMNSFSA